MASDVAIIGLGYVGLPLAEEASRVGLKVLGFDVSQRVVDGLNAGRSHVDDLSDGDVLRAGDLEVRVVATPGHTADSVSFALAADHALLTGDTVLGRGTTVVAHPDGQLAAYLDSLERIKALTGDGAVATILPGHGPTVPDAAAMVDFYRVHRRERLDQVRAAMAEGARDADAVVATVYADVDRSVWPAAKMSVLAQMRFLESA